MVIIPKIIAKKKKEHCATGVSSPSSINWSMRKPNNKLIYEQAVLASQLLPPKKKFRIMKCFQQKLILKTQTACKLTPWNLNSNHFTGNKIILVKNSNWLDLKIQNSIAENKISYKPQGPLPSHPLLWSTRQTPHGHRSVLPAKKNPFYKQSCTQICNTLSWLMSPHTVMSTVTKSKANLLRSGITLKIAIITRGKDPI